MNPDRLSSALRYSELQSEHRSLSRRTKQKGKHSLLSQPSDISRTSSSSTDAHLQLLETALLAEEVTLLGVFSSNASRWDCPVPYTIAADFHDPAKILKGLNLIAEVTRWQFVERTTETAYITFVNSDSCLSYIGRRPDDQQPQAIEIATGCGFASVAHEVLHALGLNHEHIRCVMY